MPFRQFDWGKRCKRMIFLTFHIPKLRPHLASGHLYRLALCDFWTSTSNTTHSGVIVPKKRCYRSLLENTGKRSLWTTFQMHRSMQDVTEPITVTYSSLNIIILCILNRRFRAGLVSLVTQCCPTTEYRVGFDYSLQGLSWLTNKRFPVLLRCLPFSAECTAATSTESLRALYGVISTVSKVKGRI